MIKRILWSACLMAAVAAAPGVGLAQPAPALRVQWEVDQPRDGLQAVCGRVFNDQSVAAWHVVLLVEGLDGADQVTKSRQVEVTGEVPSDGWAFFCVPEQAGASNYRVRVIGVGAGGARRPQEGEAEGDHHRESANLHHVVLPWFERFVLPCAATATRL